jgi:nucleoside-diphosphate kinase
MSQTLIIVKPDAVGRGLVGEFLSRFERMGLKIGAIRVVREKEEFWNQFYPSDLDWFENVGRKTLLNCTERKIDVRSRLGTDDPAKIGRKVKGWLVAHMSSGDAVAVVLEGNEAPTKVRIACGATLPNVASPGTIRFDYSCDSPASANDDSRSLYNLIHASDPSEARGGDPALLYEIRLMFPDIA